MDTVKALLEKYPDANLTVTADHYSKQFQEFQKYHPNGIVQYSASTNPGNPAKEERQLLVTIIFDKYNDPNNLPITIVQCTNQNHEATFVTEFPAQVFPRSGSANVLTIVIHAYDSNKMFPTSCMAKPATSSTAPA